MFIGNGCLLVFSANTTTGYIFTTCFCNNVQAGGLHLVDRKENSDRFYILRKFLKTKPVT